MAEEPSRDAPVPDASPPDGPLPPPPPPGEPAIDGGPAAPPPPPPPPIPAPGIPPMAGAALPGVNPLRELLFADLPAAQARSVFANAGDAGRTLVALADAAGRGDTASARAALASAPAWNTDTRLHLQAWSLARDAGVDAGDDSKDVLGVVVDMGLEEGLDTLAGFADGSARYLNHSGSAIVWEVPDMAIGSSSASCWTRPRSSSSWARRSRASGSSRRPAATRCSRCSPAAGSTSGPARSSPSARTRVAGR